MSEDLLDAVDQAEDQILAVLTQATVDISGLVAQIATHEPARALHLQAHIGEHLGALLKLVAPEPPPMQPAAPGTMAPFLSGVFEQLVGIMREQVEVQRERDSKPFSIPLPARHLGLEVADLMTARQAAHALGDPGLIAQCEENLRRVLKSIGREDS